MENHFVSVVSGNFAGASMVLHLVVQAKVTKFL